MKRTIVRFYPADGSELKKVADELKRDYLSAAVDSENEDGTINLIVSNPLGQNERADNVPSDKSASSHFEDVL